MGQDPIQVVTPADRTEGPTTPGMDRQQAFAGDGLWAGFVRTDVELAAYPDAAYLILSLADPHAPVLRAFRIRDGQVDEEPVEVSPRSGVAG